MTTNSYESALTPYWALSTCCVKGLTRTTSHNPHTNSVNTYHHIRLLQQTDTLGEVKGLACSHTAGRWPRPARSVCMIPKPERTFFTPHIANAALGRADRQVTKCFLLLFLTTTQDKPLHHTNSWVKTTTAKISVVWCHICSFRSLSHAHDHGKGLPKGDRSGLGGLARCSGLPGQLPGFA